MTKEEQDKLIGMVPELPKAFKDYMISLFEGHHITYFSRPDGDILTECCHCGMVARFRPGKTSKSIIPAWGGEKPKDGDKYICPMCREETTLRKKGNRKYSIDSEYDLWYGQRLPDGGYILRFFRPILKSYPDSEGCYEEIWDNEKVRYFFPVGMKKKAYKLYRHDSWIYSPISGYSYNGGWDSSSCFNTMSYFYQGPTRGEIYPETFENMKGTVMEYSLSEEVMDDLNFYNYNLGEWQQAYIQNKWFESLYKMGLSYVIEYKLRGYPGRIFNYRAKTIWDYLKVYKTRLKELEKANTYNDTIALLKAFQLERKCGEHWGPEVTELIKLGFTAEDMEYLKQFMTYKKLLNYLNKHRVFPMAGIKVLYCDYIKMTEKSGYDMTSSINLFPKNLMEAHDKRTEETNKAEADRRKKQVEDRFKAIKGRFKGADKIYHFEKGSLIIRPAMTASEIVDEGRILHHCVGGDNYLESHAKRKTIICFLRKKKDPETPYITVEINPDGEIEQWYGVHDSKPSEKRIDKWLDGYRKQLEPAKLRREAHRKIKAS